MIVNQVFSKLVVGPTPQMIPLLEPEASRLILPADCDDDAGYWRNQIFF